MMVGSFLAYLAIAAIIPPSAEYILFPIFIIAVVAILTGFILTALSGLIGRVADGVIMLALSALMFGQQMESSLSWVPIATTLLGLALIAISVPKVAEVIRSNDLSFGMLGNRHTGIVRNLKAEGGIQKFWLEIAGKGGKTVRVEAPADYKIAEGDVVSVRGSSGGDGVIKAEEIRTRGQGSTDVGTLSKKGEAEFSGIVLGNIYEVRIRRSLLMFLTDPMLGLRIQRLDSSGNPLEVVEAEFKAGEYSKIAFDHDNVVVKGRWTDSGRLRLKELANKTTGTRIKISDIPWRQIVFLFLVLLIAVVILFLLMR